MLCGRAGPASIPQRRQCTHVVRNFSDNNLKLMEAIFENPEANKISNSILLEISEIITVIENVDDLMPSASKDQKLSVDPKINEQFKEIANDSFTFFDNKISNFKKQMDFIKDSVGESNSYKSIGDAIVILGCKILQFQIGKVSWLVNRKEFSSNNAMFKPLIKADSDLLFEVKRRLHVLTTFSVSEVGKDELVRTDKNVILLSKKLDNRSFWKRLFNT